MLVPEPVVASIALALYPGWLISVWTICCHLFGAGALDTLATHTSGVKFMVKVDEHTILGQMFVGCKVKHGFPVING